MSVLKRQRSTKREEATHINLARVGPATVDLLLREHPKRRPRAYRLAISEAGAKLDSAVLESGESSRHKARRRVWQGEPALFLRCNLENSVRNQDILSRACIISDLTVAPVAEANVAAISEVVRPLRWVWGSIHVELVAPNELGKVRVFESGCVANLRVARRARWSAQARRKLFTNLLARVVLRHPQVCLQVGYAVAARERACSISHWRVPHSICAR